MQRKGILHFICNELQHFMESLPFMTLICTQHIIFKLKKHLSQKNGQLGEQAACNFLKEQGYSIACRNWRTGRLEVDIICFDQMNTLVFVEVKTRSSKHFGAPGNFVDAKKRRHLMTAAEAYCQKFEHSAEIRFDIISIILVNETIQEIEHFCDAFYETG